MGALGDPEESCGEPWGTLRFDCFSCFFPSADELRIPQQSCTAARRSTEMRFYPNILANILRFWWTFGCSGGSDGLCWTPGAFWRGKCGDYGDAQTNGAQDGRCDQRNANNKNMHRTVCHRVGRPQQTVHRVLGEATTHCWAKPQHKRWAILTEYV